MKKNHDLRQCCAFHFGIDTSRSGRSVDAIRDNVGSGQPNTRPVREGATDLNRAVSDRSGFNAPVTSRETSSSAVTVTDARSQVIDHIAVKGAVARMLPDNSRNRPDQQNFFEVIDAGELASRWRVPKIGLGLRSGYISFPGQLFCFSRMGAVAYQRRH